ncbi:MAG: ThuA domain-containing protein [Actinomycetota bacterium]
MTVWLVTGGHPFERDPLLDAFAGLHGVDPGEIEHLEQPDALDRIRPGHVGDDVGAIVFYDMPGLRFTRGDPPVEFVDPPDGYVAGLRRLLADGVGMVFLHHAIASWPTSHDFADLVGGRFHYQPGELAGTAYPDSGYVFDVAHTVDVVDRDHPVCAGLPSSFELTDELYLFPTLPGVVPLMRTRHDVTSTAGFSSADLAVRGQRNSSDGWTHPPGSDLVAWTRDPDEIDGRLVYLQFGDGPVTYADPTFRQVLANAIGWVRGA